MMKKIIISLIALLIISSAFAQNATVSGQSVVLRLTMYQASWTPGDTSLWVSFASPIGTYYTKHTVSGNSSIRPLTSTKVLGGTAQAKLVGAGKSLNFVDMYNIGALEFDSTTSVVNTVLFMYDGYNYNYQIISTKTEP